MVDRYYTPVALFIQLLSMNLYALCTIMTNTIDYCVEVIDKRKARPRLHLVESSSCRVQSMYQS